MTLDSKDVFNTGNVVIMDEGIATLPLFISKDGSCIYETLQSLGAPDHKKLHLLPGYKLSGKIEKWLDHNWSSNPELMKVLVGIRADYKTGKLKSLPVRSDLVAAIVRGVLYFIQKRTGELDQLTPIYFPDLTLAGTPIPKVSKVFNNMTFAERQAILQANLQRVEKVEFENEDKLQS